MREILEQIQDDCAALLVVKTSLQCGLRTLAKPQSCSGRIVGYPEITDIGPEGRTPWNTGASRTEKILQRLHDATVAL
jgi:hypothetical protein